MATTGHKPTLPLLGVTVVELTNDKSEMCGRFLADLGADVTLVEPPGGSAGRSSGPMHDDVSIPFAVRNLGKQSVEIDLESGAGRGSFRRLISSTDLLIETTGPGELAGLGLDYDSLHAFNPRLVVLSITDFGQTGPYRDYVATLPVLDAMAPVLCRSGKPGREPLLPPAGFAVEAGIGQAAWAAVVGLWNAQRTGVGDHIDFSIFEATGQVMDPAMGMVGTAMSATPQAVTWLSRDRPSTRPYPIFRCADGHVRIVLLSTRQWQAMGEWLGNPEGYPPYGNISTRAHVVRAIEPMIIDLVKDKTMDELVDEGQRLGVPIAPVLTAPQVLSSDHYISRNAILHTEIAKGVWATVPNGYLYFNGDRAGIRGRSASCGEHNHRLAPEVPAQSSPFPRLNEPNPQRALAGVRVLDLGIIVYGAEIGRLFADQGAEVIKVENRAYPDGARIALGSDMNSNFAAGNRGKLSVGINLRSSEGLEIVKQLVAKSDIVLANFKPGTLESLGLGFEVLRAANPSIVVVQCSAMGSTGPWQRWMGYGPLVRCAAGLTNLWQYDDDPEFFGDVISAYPDNYCARMMAASGLAALIHSKRTGQAVDVSGAQAEIVLSALSTVFAAESVDPGSAFRVAHQGMDSPWGVFPCKGDDEWCVITVRDDEDWTRLVAVVRDESLSDKTLATRDGRAAAADRVAKRLSEWTIQRSPREVQETLQSAGIPAGGMQRVDDFMKDPHLTDRNYLTVLNQPGVGLMTLENAPFGSRNSLPPEVRPAPFLGEHTREVLSTLLEFDDLQIHDLIERGVIEASPPL
jgi:crotonobetainyl-CoA:carnitine CoA-transferase CaiB-like acyl-CoA transferase